MSNMLKLLNDNSGDTVGQLMALSEKAAEYGIRLTEEAVREIAVTEKSSVTENRRICFGKSAAVKLTEKFSQSSYLDNNNFAETICLLVEAFYL